MATYAIGDVQGCFEELQNLLQFINFNPAKDKLWFAGDLVNRGPKSLEVLRFVKSLKNPVVVLGNHDLHLLAIANGHPFKDHFLHDVLTAPDRDQLINWLRRQPLVHYDARKGYAMVHAGLPPQWTLKQAKRYATEVEQALRGEKYVNFLEHLYGNKPLQWNRNLRGWSRLRFITNALTRIRFCNEEGMLDLSSRGEIGSQPKGYLPWYQIPERASANVKIIFGHWAALQGKTNSPHVYALDTGCVWGNALTAMRLEDEELFSVSCKGYLKTAAIVSEQPH